jgi:hypothetical protein
MRSRKAFWRNLHFHILTAENEWGLATGVFAHSASIQPAEPELQRACLANPAHQMQHHRDRTLRKEGPLDRLDSRRRFGLN